MGLRGISVYIVDPFSGTGSEVCEVGLSEFFLGLGPGSH